LQIWQVWQVIMKQKSFVLITRSKKIDKTSFASIFVIDNILNVKNNLKNYSLIRLLVIEGWAKLAISNSQLYDVTRKLFTFIDVLLFSDF